ncbi:7 transmembrane receptor [Necator americanus]|uniref:7 transmembrane receptor n=1 Tax=Necator americanus TaxID=51031 RepID=W2TC78_NECAM|nr:7 transmembrane receptor [Necator americanus]ETN79204.1 7 transmembrane receptor [Necator americanus]
MIADPVHNYTCTFYEWSRNPHHAKFFRIFSIISVLTVLVVVVVLGNALVIAAVLLRRRLRSATGLLILSLGVADLLVGTVILPFSIANEVLNGYWIFGETWCTIWLTMDIWMCTASIYNLVAISIDRYIAIIKPLNYPMLVTKFRARCTVAIVWIGSFIICSPSFFLASSIKDVNQEPCKCTPANAGRAYITFSASSSFYVPMVIVIFVYFRIYIAARAATKSIYSGMMQVTANANKNTKSYLINHPNVLAKESLPMLRVHRGSSVTNIRPPHLSSRVTNAHNGSGATNSQRESNASLPTIRHDGEGQVSVQHPTSPNRRVSRDKSPVPTKMTTEKASTASEDSAGSPTKQKAAHLEPEANCDMPTPKIPLRAKLRNNPLRKLMQRGHAKKSGCAYEKRLSLEIKAAKTVAIVTGCFIFCWLGFSLLYGLELQTNDVIWSVLFWLGYLNSALNPVIYTVFNREFRTCFKRLLTCHHLNHPTTNKVSK